MDVTGADIGQIDNSNPKDCISNCFNDTDCQAVIWDFKESVCWKKGHFTERKYTGHGTSHVRFVTVEMPQTSTCFEDTNCFTGFIAAILGLVISVFHVGHSLYKWKYPNAEKDK